MSHGHHGRHGHHGLIGTLLFAGALAARHAHKHAAKPAKLKLDAYAVKLSRPVSCVETTIAYVDAAATPAIAMHHAIAMANNGTPPLSAIAPRSVGTWSASTATPVEKCPPRYGARFPCMLATFADAATPWHVLARVGSAFYWFGSAATLKAAGDLEPIALQATGGRASVLITRDGSVLVSGDQVAAINASARDDCPGAWFIPDGNE